MIKTIVIEDEVNVREALKKMLHIIEPAIEVVAETAFVSDAVNLIKKYKPALVFLDIELEDGTGFDILNKLDNLDFNIIFTTAYNQYTIKTFKYSTINYLLKPIDPGELESALDRTIKNINDKKENQELLQVLQKNHNKKAHKIVLKTTEQRYIVVP
ncbi:MAG TPA: response regulator [Arcobacter sp.]|nr:response regulator [Arcobacter sp.]